MKRLLIYSQDGMGLGHLRRTRSIAHQVLDWEPDCSVLIVADSPVTPFFPSRPGVDYLKLPTIVKTGDVSWESGLLPMNVEDLVHLRSTLIVHAFSEFRPDAILVDHMPVGAMGELKALLDAASRRVKRPRLYLGLRDVLGAPHVIRKVWTGLGAYEYLPRYDALLIYGCREIYPVEAAYRLTPFAPKLTYCHYVVVSPAAADAPPLPEGEPLILVMAGGGRDGFRLTTAFLEGLPLLLRDSPMRSVILTGPNMPSADYNVLLRASASLPVEVRRSSEDATAWLGQASAVLTMAGYNSLCEVLSWRKKALVVPRARPSREQRIRSRMFSKRRLIRMLDPDFLTPERLAGDLARLVTEDGIPDLARIPPLDGAERAATVILAR